MIQRDRRRVRRAELREQLESQQHTEHARARACTAFRRLRCLARAADIRRQLARLRTPVRVPAGQRTLQDRRDTLSALARCERMRGAA